MSLTRDLARLHSDSDGNLILANNLTVDTNTLKVDATTNKVGIGTTSGTGKLTVQDSLPKIQANYNDAAHLEFGVGGSGGGFVTTTGHFVTFNHQPYSDKGTDNNLTERMRITNAGNVGIGESTPTQALVIQDDTQDNVAIKYSGTTGGHQSGYLFKDKRDQTNAAIFNDLQNDAVGTQAAHMKFATSTGGTLSTRMDILSDGKVRYHQTANSATQEYINASYDSLHHFRFSMYMVGSTSYVIRMTGFSNGIHKVKCAGSHWSSSYMTYRESYLGMDIYNGLTENNIMNQNSGAQGNWSFSRPANGKLDIVKAVGTYGGGMTSMIEIVGPRTVNIESII